MLRHNILIIVNTFCFLLKVFANVSNKFNYIQFLVLLLFSFLRNCTKVMQYTLGLPLLVILSVYRHFSHGKGYILH